jgi:phosphonate metabolism protein PhnN/1,5-bisphosphokinase (PRPP-forming)
MTRYALYFTPSADSPWSAAGTHWLGRDAATDQLCPQPEILGLNTEQFLSMTTDARRYGFHATLKAPFRLADGFSEAHLLKMAEAFCAMQKPITLRETYIDLHGDFLALQIADVDDEINLLADQCTSYFDLLRAAPTETELARRRCGGLTPRQEELLQRWGYPHTEELFRFHMTLSGSLKDAGRDVVAAVRDAAIRHFADAKKQEALTINGLTILREDSPGAPFVEWQRFDFDATNKQAALPVVGRLFYCVGPSGVGKGAVLQWAQQHLIAQDRIVFAQRTITRPAYFNESHEAVDFATFWQLAAGGQLAMMWQNNDLCYGVRRSIVADLKAGCDVVVNGSHAYLPQLRKTFPDAIVVWIGGQENLMRARLDAQQSEAGPVSLKRLYRSADFMPPDEPHVVPLDNRGPLEAVGKRLLGLLSDRQ